VRQNRGEVELIREKGRNETYHYPQPLLLLFISEQFCVCLSDYGIIFLFHDSRGFDYFFVHLLYLRFDNYLLSCHKRGPESNGDFRRNRRQPLHQSGFHHSFVKKGRDYAAMDDIFIALVDFPGDKLCLYLSLIGREFEVKTRGVFFSADKAVMIVFKIHFHSREEKKAGRLRRFSGLPDNTVILFVHLLKEVFIALCAHELAEEELHTFNRAQRGQYLSQYPHLVEDVFFHKKLFLPCA